MNEHLVERFSRQRAPLVSHEGREQAFVLFQPARLNQAVKAYYNATTPVGAAAPWLRYSDLPSSAEIQDLAVDGQAGDIVGLVPNMPVGAWPSKDAYLSAQYEMLREDAVRPLREAVCTFRSMPHANEDAFDSNIGIYERVRIIGYTASTRGFAVHVSFSIRRTGKTIKWSQSNRLRAGSLVALFSGSDDSAKVVVATVAARPSAGTDLNPPEVDLLFARAEEVEIDPSIEWTMLEARGGMFEASKHVLSALQHMSHEQSSFMEHLVEVKKDITAPPYLQKQPVLNLSSALVDNKHETYEAVNVLSKWPQLQGQSSLDASQLEALRRILTTRLAIVQGPPGTGKTFVSVQALQAMLTNHKNGDPPIIVACQTNHAIDQILRLVAKFESKFARLGGFSKDEGVIKARTLYHLKGEKLTQKLPGSIFQSARTTFTKLAKEIATLLEPLSISESAIDPDILLKHGLLTEQQVTSLATGASRWVQTELATGSKTRSPFHVWLADKIMPVPHKPQPEVFEFEIEEEDAELEQLQEIEAENQEDHEFGLDGQRYKLADNFTTKASHKEMQKVAQLLTEQDLWKIPESARSAVYCYLQKALKAQLLQRLRPMLAAYEKACADLQIGRLEKSESILRDQKLIGMTTTGLNKYRGILSAMGCKICLIEEAAETLEAPVITACWPSLEHLILVGDHKQLRPHCQVKQLEVEFAFNVSLFERLINNQLDYTTLTKQRRMIPEICRLLRPIYGGILKNHHSVLDRPSIPGMGGINSWFFSHHHLETRNELMSYQNTEEAAMIYHFAQYLAWNGTKAEDITIITFYRGQFALLNKKFRQTGVKIATVDSYQGEENSIVILSTVRSNTAGAIGFLAVDNRTCVALSRAKNGFYIFGNAMVLGKCKVWTKVVKIIAGKDRPKELPAIEPVRFDAKLPITCQKHGKRSYITNTIEWDNNDGGCNQKCDDQLPCGHPCPQLCHPYDHDTIACPQPCEKTLECGHACQKTCTDPCDCGKCPKVKDDGRNKGSSIKNGTLQSSVGSIKNGSIKTGNTVEAQDGPAGTIWQARRMSHPSQSSHSSTSHSSPRRGSPLRQELLIDIGDSANDSEPASNQPPAPPLKENSRFVTQKDEGSVSSTQSLLDMP